ncbi:hypothetical protein AAIR29_06440 [Psychrobacter sp. FBL11]|uniref:Uncharacterized protein n=1 Tax=Psychrobacter saeujeotis TaxID=3143436 RepID=A0ABU9X790_9GAMM|nr:hypothetical protein [uncultured Psychrobacter sp.]
MKTSNNLPKSSTQYARLSSKDLLSLYIHPEAKTAYKLYVEYFPIDYIVLTENQTIHFDVFYDRMNFYFYNNFSAQLVMANSTDVYVKKLQPTISSINLESWKYVLEEFLNLNPVNIDIYNQLKVQMPEGIQRKLFGKLMTIEDVCRRKGISRHHFDYQQAKQKCSVFKMPSFDELIQRNVNGD